MDCPVESVLTYWLKNAPAWGVTLIGAYLAYDAAMSWKQEFVAKRRIEAAEKIVTAMHTYVSELKRCRSRDGKYPHEAPVNEVSSQEAEEQFSGWQKRFGGFSNEYFKEAKSASITVRVYFPKRAHELVEEIIALRIAYINAFKEATKPGVTAENRLKFIRILVPSKAQDITIQRADILMSELEELVLDPYLKPSR